MASKGAIFSAIAKGYLNATENLQKMAIAKQKLQQEKEEQENKLKLENKKIDVLSDYYNNKIKMGEKEEQDKINLLKSLAGSISPYEFSEQGYATAGTYSPLKEEFTPTGELRLGPITPEDILQQEGYRPKLTSKGISYELPTKTSKEQAEEIQQAKQSLVNRKIKEIKANEEEENRIKKLEQIYSPKGIIAKNVISSEIQGDKISSEEQEDLFTLARRGNINAIKKLNEYRSKGLLNA